MNSINTSESFGLSNQSSRVDKTVSSSRKENLGSINSLSHSLPDLGKLSNDAANSGEDIRPEAIARAKELLGDANWLSDYNIDGLANKLIDIENI